MKLLLAASALVALPAGTDLETDYTSERTLRITASTSLEMETTNSSMERDGEPVEGGFGGGSATLEERTVEQSYKVLAHEDGAPTTVRRAFGAVSRSTTTEMGEQSFEGGGDGALADVTLELTLEDDEVMAEVVDGSEPDQESALLGHSLTLAFDGLLPEGEVDEDDTWEVEADAILRALALDMEDAYFPLEERSDDESEGGRGGRGRGGFGGSRPSTLRNLVNVEWEGEATFKGEAEHNGIACFEIGLELEAEGDLPERNFGGGGRRGGRAFSMLFGRPAPVESTISAELEARLLFAAEGGYPVLFEVEGTISTVSDREFEGRGGSAMSIHTEQEGAFEYVVEVEVEAEEE